MSRQCHQCAAAMINGVYCHEIGCPESGKQAFRDCKWCGAKLEGPKKRNRGFCNNDCEKSYKE